MKKILVPVDFSEYSENAIDYALSLAEKIGGEIRLFHAFSDPYVHRPGAVGDLTEPQNTSQVILNMVEYEAEKNMTSAKERFENKIRTRQLENVFCSTEIKRGFAEDEIIREAAAYKPHLILMGAHGHNRINRIFF